MSEMNLRPYQRKAIDDLYAWFPAHPGNPCVVLPTGAGKSIILAKFCEEALTSWPQTRILILTHVRELIEQDANALVRIWPLAPMGIYSAGLGKKELDYAITFAGIQSIWRKAADVGHVDLVIVDECHLISHKDQGSYRKFIDDLTEINPSLRVIGLTATPFRLGHGLITDKPALFSAPLIEPTSIKALQKSGYLALLRSKVTKAKLSTEGVGKRGGEFIEHELQKAVDVQETSEAVVREVIARASDRKAWLFFCTGVDHALHVRDILLEEGITAECVTGDTPKAERDRIIEDFKAGRLRALTNANVLTTGFDYPDIDCIVMMRPTMSPGLYLQMVGRGMRLKSHGGDCLVLDFAGVIEQHGPVTDVNIPGKKGKGGLAPSKLCPECDEIVHASVMTCPACGYEWPKKEKESYRLRDDDIMGIHGKTMNITQWKWSVHVGAKSEKEMLMCTYYGALSDPIIREYFCIFHAAGVSQRAMARLKRIADHCRVSLMQPTTEALCDALTAAEAPYAIEYKKDGKFFQVMDRFWPVQGIRIRS